MKTKARQVNCEQCKKSIDAHLAHQKIKEHHTLNDEYDHYLVYLCFECYHDVENPSWRLLNK